MRTWPLLLCTSYPSVDGHPVPDGVGGDPIGEFDDAAGDDPVLLAREPVSAPLLPVVRRIAPPVPTPPRSRPGFLIRVLLI